MTWVKAELASPSKMAADGLARFYPL